MKKKPNIVKDLIKSNQPNQTDSVDMDETAYLLSNEVNKKRLLDAIKEMNQGIYRDNTLIE